MFEDHQRKEGSSAILSVFHTTGKDLLFQWQETDSILPQSGKTVSHQFAKELLVGFAAAEVDKLAETKGEDFFDRERAKHEAKKNAERMVGIPTSYNCPWEKSHARDFFLDQISGG